VAEHSSQDIVHRGVVKRIIDACLALFTSAWVAVSDSQTPYLLERKSVRRSRLHVIANGVDFTRMHYSSRTAARERYGMPCDAFVIGSVAVLRPEKDHCAMVDAFALLVGEFEDCLLVIVGDGPSAGEIKSRIALHGLEDQVLMLGAVRDVGTVLPGFDLFVSASLTEALPLSIVEAMGAGVPVVATSVGGVPELLENGRSGVLVDSGDPIAMASELRLLVNDSAARSTLGEAGRRRATRFDAAVMADQYESVLDALCGSKRAGDYVWS
jgi:glycosyltransferase involved in cell wall biosynthesis